MSDNVTDSITELSQDSIRERTKAILADNWQHLSITLPGIIEKSKSHLDRIDDAMATLKDPQDLSSLAMARDRVINSINHTIEQQAVLLMSNVRNLLKLVEMIEAPTGAAPKETVQTDTEASEVIDTTDLTQDQLDLLRKLDIIPPHSTDSES